MPEPTPTNPSGLADNRSGATSPFAGVRRLSECLDELERRRKTARQTGRSLAINRTDCAGTANPLEHSDEPAIRVP